MFAASPKQAAAVPHSIAVELLLVVLSDCVVAGAGVQAYLVYPSCWACWCIMITDRWLARVAADIPFPTGAPSPSI